MTTQSRSIILLLFNVHFFHKKNHQNSYHFERERNRANNIKGHLNIVHIIKLLDFLMRKKIVLEKKM